MDLSSPGTALCARNHYCKKSAPDATSQPVTALESIHRRTRSTESRRLPEARSSLSGRAAFDDHFAAHLIRLLISSCHRRTLYGGVQLTLLRLRYWILRRRAMTKYWLHRCVTYTRWKGVTPQPPMDNLPQRRVTSARPFLRTGIDYAGLLLIRTNRGRGHRSHKAFITIFMCLCSKATHLEVIVSDYTTDTFWPHFVGSQHVENYARISIPTVAEFHWRRSTDTRASSCIFRQRPHRACCCHRRNSMALQPIFRTPFRRPLRSSSKVDEVPSSKSNRQHHAHLRGDEHSLSSGRGLPEFSALAGVI
ncbi:PREDICTED: uncharacterized protein LOC105149250 [Acromyrmex echinatior]|uniref:uncharacterized protein LOC105149250 n=1 Tax=Acromyrmex echinatior TaxID=103372 RepID=UPI000580C07E|nr:PREDICTED: uncharacterized protein LOC105149250 [Acromyrmex echinatior]